MSASSNRLVEVGVVLQGGGALGAYECGALNALLELMDEFAAQGRRIALKVVTGVSIGSINAACVVGATGAAGFATLFEQAASNTAKMAA